MDENTKLFILDLVQDCCKYDVTLYLAARTTFLEIEMGDTNIPCSGFFSGDNDGETPELAVAIGGDMEQWLPVLVHESCHMDQWHEKSPLWESDNGDDPTSMIDEWISRSIEYDKKTINHMFKSTIALELDCEKRSVEKIKKYDLPINIDTFIQKANAYLMFYLFCKKHRKWNSSKTSPYMNSISTKLSKNWYPSYTKLPKEIEQLFINNLTFI